jgi:hypothetical protein
VFPARTVPGLGRAVAHERNTMRKLVSWRWVTIAVMAAGLVGLTATSASADVNYDSYPPDGSLIVGPGCSGSWGIWQMSGTGWQPTSSADYSGPDVLKDNLVQRPDHDHRDSSVLLVSVPRHLVRTDLPGLRLHPQRKCRGQQRPLRFLGRHRLLRKVAGLAWSNHQPGSTRRVGPDRCRCPCPGEHPIFHRHPQQRRPERSRLVGGGWRHGLLLPMRMT